MSLRFNHSKEARAGLSCGPSCNRAHRALPLPPLESGTAENDVNVASRGGHGIRNNEVRTRLLDGPCDGGDNPSDQTMGGRARVSKEVDCANCVAGNDLPASTPELVLKVRQAVPRNQLELGSRAAHHCKPFADRGSCSCSRGIRRRDDPARSIATRS
jgi:hypothetical protein